MRAPTQSTIRPLSPAELGVSLLLCEALHEVLALLRSGEVTHLPMEHDGHNAQLFPSGPAEPGPHLNMGVVEQHLACGTVACLAGWAQILAERRGVHLNLVGHWPRSERLPPIIEDLFQPEAVSCMDWRRITLEQATTALWNTLHVPGGPRWSEVLA